MTRTGTGTGTRSQEPGARSQEPGAGSQDREPVTGPGHPVDFVFPTFLEQKDAPSAICTHRKTPDQPPSCQKEASTASSESRILAVNPDAAPTTANPGAPTHCRLLGESHLSIPDATPTTANSRTHRSHAGYLASFDCQSRCHSNHGKFRTPDFAAGYWARVTCQSLMLLQLRQIPGPQEATPVTRRASMPTPDATTSTANSGTLEQMSVT